jgi:probable rRNA maturation factor
VLRVAIVATPADRVAVRALGPWLVRTAPRSLCGEVTIALVSDARMRALNRQFRRVDAATDVLSFPSRGGLGIGDIAIARGVAARQAKAAGHTLATETRMLALHGLLHLAGYDHASDDGRMARLEARLRKKGRLPAGLIERAAAPPKRRRP